MVAEIKLRLGFTRLQGNPDQIQSPRTMLSGDSLDAWEEWQYRLRNVK